MSDETTEPTTDQPTGNREARYRVERNEAREALDAANTRLAALQRSVIKQHTGLSDPEDLFTLTGTTEADFLDDNGDVDPARVRAAVTELTASRPGLAPRQPAVDKTPPGKFNAGHEPQWADVFRP